MAYALTCALYLGAANTGLTLTPSLFNADGTAAVGLTTDQVIEVAVGSGSYQWEGTLPDGHRGYIRFDSGATYKTHVGIEPAELEAGTVDTDEIAEAVWAYSPRTLTMSAMQIAAAITGSYLSAKRGDTWNIPITGLGDLTSRTKLYFTLKADTEGADTEALVQIEETAGLLFIDGAAGTAADGDITVEDAAAGDITIILEAVASAQLDPETYYTCDIQLVEGASVLTVYESRFEVTTDRTRAVT